MESGYRRSAYHAEQPSSWYYWSMPTETVTDDQPKAEPERSDAPMPDLKSLLPTVEALLVSADKPLKPAKLIEPLAALHDAAITTEILDECVNQLNEAYDQTGRVFRIERIADGYRVMTRPEYATAIAAMHRARASTRLSRSALETLSIVAYRQPVTRAELESIRGVGCGEILRALLDRHMVKIVGRAEELGRPMLYGTTRQFLDTFGLASIKDLPNTEELADRLQKHAE